MNAQLRKITLLFLAVCIGFAALPARSQAIGEAGTFYVQPEFGAYGTSQKSVNSIIAFGASGGYFIMDGLSLGVEALAYSFDQKGDSSYNSGRTYQKNPWAFGFNGLVRYYPIRTDKFAFFIGSGLGGMFSSDNIPSYSDGEKGSTSNFTVPADLGFTVALTQNVSFELVARYQRIGFDKSGIDAWGGHGGLRITF
jgi:hypothetical protein